MIVLNSSHITRLLPMKEAIQAVEKGFAKLASKKVIMPQRGVLTFNNVWHGIMPCILLDEGSFSVKLVSVTPENKMRDLPTTLAYLALLDARTGQLLALMEATVLICFKGGYS